MGAPSVVGVFSGGIADGLELIDCVFLEGNECWLGWGEGEKERRLGFFLHGNAGVLNTLGKSNSWTALPVLLQYICKMADIPIFRESMHRQFLAMG